jgi:hypothetical protein
VVFSRGCHHLSELSRDITQSWGYEENGGYDPWGNWNGIAVLVPEDDYEQIERIKATGPMEARANSEGPDLIM